VGYRRNVSSVDPGLYGPDSEAWRLNRESMILLGAGPRALLLQIAHPLVAEGVDQHSDFRADPWARLRATLRSYLRIVYGTTSTARAEIRRLHELHRRVAGPVQDAAVRRDHGPRYSARDPELALWVHATLIDSTIVAHDAWIERLSRARRARFYDETRIVGRAFGIREELLPSDFAAFERYLATMLGPGGPVRVSATARELARSILQPPLGRMAPSLAPLLERLPPESYAWTLWPAVGLLPVTIREGYGLAWGPVQEAVARWLVTAWRTERPFIPTALRWMPQARAADARMEAVR
jgi:uncharacterized protein (DUF2236 family)